MSDMRINQQLHDVRPNIKNLNALMSAANPATPGDDQDWLPQQIEPNEKGCQTDAPGLWRLSQREGVFLAIMSTQVHPMESTKFRLLSGAGGSLIGSILVGLFIRYVICPAATRNLYRRWVNRALVAIFMKLAIGSTGLAAIACFCPEKGLKTAGWTLFSVLIVIFQIIFIGSTR